MFSQYVGLEGWFPGRVGTDPDLTRLALKKHGFVTVVDNFAGKY